MNYRENKGLLKEGSLSAKIYFLLLKPKTQSEISRILYNGKVQLANIGKNIEKLEKKGYVKNIGKEIGVGKNFNQIYYQSTLIPIIDMIKKQVGERNETSKSKNKKALTKEDLIYLEDFLNSKWFSQFYEQGFLRDDLECEFVGETRLTSAPLRFFAFLLEEIFAIRQTMEQVNFLFKDDKTEYKNFDNYIHERKKGLKKLHIKLIKNIFNNAKTGYLGNYPSTNRTIDRYLKDFGVLFIPYELSKKLSAIGRAPLTIVYAFRQGIEEEYNKIER